MKWRNLFVSPSDNDECFYDIFEDWDLIDASITQQYGIRMRYEPDMKWDEFCSLVSGLLGDTPLGNIVQIRAETDPDRIKSMNSHEKSIRNAWFSRESKKKQINKELYMEKMKQLENAMKSIARG
jgi:hypothetical protein